MKTLLITGGTSNFGQHLVPFAAQAGWRVVYTWFSHDMSGLGDGLQLDMRDSDRVHQVARDIRPDCIIHLAGSNRSPDMEQVIEKGTASIAAAAASVRARLLFMSTDVVFDGENPPYTEADEPRPLHAYGRSKFAAEKIVQTVDNHVVIRPSLIYGLERIDRSTGWMRAALERGEQVTLFTDQLRNPIWERSLADACLELAENTFTGRLHVAGDQVLSRAEFGKRLLSWWNVSDLSRLVCAPTPAGATWPANTTLSIERARHLLQTPLPGVDAVLNRSFAKD